MKAPAVGETELFSTSICTQPAFGPVVIFVTVTIALNVPTLIFATTDISLFTPFSIIIRILL